MLTLSILTLLLPFASALSTSLTCVTPNSTPNSVALVSGGHASTIFVSPDDWPGVYRTVTDFTKDIGKVTGVTPKIVNTTSSISSSSTIPVIVGTLGHSSLISSVLTHASSSAQPFLAINGSWESYHASLVSNPLPNVKQAYVIVGSDKRGTIFALYELSEQAGVSPWWWWADVPPTKSSSLFLSSTPCSHGAPSVKYRGIFLNDEQPALQNWAQEKFTNNFGGGGAGQAIGGADEVPFGASGDPTKPDSGTNPTVPFNHFFYTRLFELILRMRGNYLWPAQWSSAFGQDDSSNQFLADLYGVVMGTSHEEPMMRSIPVEWDRANIGPWDFTVNPQNITQFWINGTERGKDFEGVWTVGMRGDGDEPASEGTNIMVLENIVAVQRQILSQVFNVSDVTTIPQVWALYKEVQGYYEDGMRVDDDIALLWTDDNWGNIRRFPIPSERNRTGGAGVYYHVDYVGDPRDYKWIQSSQLSKMHEQLNLAFQRDARQIWIVNVGDLKPSEMATEFFITLGYDFNRFSLQNSTTSFISTWAQREFDVNANDAGVVTEIMANLTRWNMRRKPELLNSTTYSLVNYHEAENVLQGWAAAVDASTKIYNSLSSTTKPAFFELVHHPVLASANLQRMETLAGLNNIFASQARLAANDLADEVQNLFENDWELENQYHTLLDGKWDHMMDQTHIGYVYWQQNMQNVMPPISRVPSRKQALPGPMRIAIEGSIGAWPGDNMNDCAQMFSCGPPTLLPLDNFNPVQSRWIDIGAGGPNAFSWNISTNVTWLNVNPSKGTIDPSQKSSVDLSTGRVNGKETRVTLSVDWSKVPDGTTAFANILISASAKGQGPESQQMFFVANKATVSNDFHGFVESDGTVTFEAAHATRNNAVNGVQWTEIPNYGRTLSGVTPMPVLGNNENNFTTGTGPVLEYDFFTFTPSSSINNGSLPVTVFVSPSLNGFGNDRPLGFATQLDSGAPQAHYFIPFATPGNLPAQWDGNDGWAANSIVSVQANHAISGTGKHTLRVFMIEPAVVIQRVVINTGGVRASYLGPPESVKV